MFPMVQANQTSNYFLISFLTTELPLYLQTMMNMVLTPEVHTLLLYSFSTEHK